MICARDRAMRTDTAFVLLLAASLIACSPTDDDAAPGETTDASATAVAPFGAGENVFPFAIGSLQAATLKDADFAPPNNNQMLAINRTKAEVDELQQRYLAALQALYRKHRLAHGQRGDPEDITTVG